MTDPQTVLFLDTNIFLHYQSFEQIDWLGVTGAKSVLLVIPPVIVRELNKHKETHSQTHIRKRAGKVIHQLGKLLEDSSGAHVRDNVDIFLEAHDPRIDFAENKLREEIQDDQLIASILAYQYEYSPEDVRLVTADAGLQLLGKARSLGIRPLRLSEELRLPPEQDADAKRIQELEQKLRVLETRIPKLSLVFSNGDQHIKFSLNPPTEILEEHIQKDIEKLKLKFPKREVPESSDLAEQVHSLISLTQAFGNLGMDNLTPEEIDGYNERLDAFYRRYEEYLVRLGNFQNVDRRVFELSIFIVNKGTAPAEDIHVFLHFPDGFQLLPASRLPREPEPPVPPEEPKSPQQKMFEQIANIQNVPYLSDLSSLRSSSSASEPQPNVSSPTIRRTNSYDVELHVQKVKHNLPEELDSLYVLFDSYDSATSFGIDYRILAANVPQPVTGKLHVIVNRVNDHE